MRTLAGKAEVAVGDVVVRPSFLSEVVVELPEGTRERDSLGGKFTRPNGLVENPQVRFTLYLPSIDYLKDIFPGRYNAPTGEDTAGNIIANADSCMASDSYPVNIHFVCEENDNNDVYLYSAEPKLDFNLTLNSSDETTVEVTLFAQEDEDGNIYRLGTGDLTQESIYDAESETTVPVVS